jgi:hypothetical protein
MALSPCTAFAVDYFPFSGCCPTGSRTFQYNYQNASRGTVTLTFL